MTEPGPWPRRWEYLELWIFEDGRWQYGGARERHAPYRSTLLNELGADGWELAGVAALAGAEGFSSTCRLFFKRPRP